MVMTRVILACLLAMLSWVATADEFKISSLIIPQGISYQASKVSFTRDEAVLDGRIDRKTIKSIDTNNGQQTFSEEHSSAEDVDSADSSFVRKAGASANARASLWTGLSASAEVHGSAEKNANVKTHSGKTTTSKNDAVSNHDSASRNADSVEESMRGSYGDWCLKFSIVFKNLDISDVCWVRPTNEMKLSAIVTGLSQPVVVPCVRQQAFAIGIDDVVCKFITPIHDRQLLKELKELDSHGGMEKLAVVVDGANFPVISQASGKNVLQAVKLAELKNPTTEFRLKIGEAKVLSPWKIKHRFGRSSGRRGQFVTLRDAINAINVKVAEDDSMPEQVLEYDSSSNLISVAGIKFGIANPSCEILPCFRFDDDVGRTRLRVLDQSLLDTPINQFKTIEICDFDCDEMIEAYKKNPQKYATVYHEMLDVLKNGDQSNRRVALVYGSLLLESNDMNERNMGYDTLLTYWEKKGDLFALDALFTRYLKNTKDFPFRDKISDWVSELLQNEQWIANTRNCAQEILNDLINDNQTDAVALLTKVPTFACSTNGVTALMRIAGHGNVSMAKCFLQGKKYDVNVGNAHVGTALEWASRANRVEMCKYLIDLGADPNITFGEDVDRYSTAVDMAAESDSVDALAYLIENANGKIRHALFRAVEAGSYNAFMYLKDKFKVDTNEQWCNIPLLSYASWGGNLRLCEQLIDSGAVVDGIKDVDDDDLPISVACKKKRFEIVDLLMRKGAKVTYPAVRSLFRNGSADWLYGKVSAGKIDAGIALLGAIEMNDGAEVSRFARFIDVNTEVSQYEWLPLDWAAKCDCVNAARALIRSGAKVNFCVKNHFTPIQRACYSGSLDMVKFLYLECGAIVDDAVFIALKQKQKTVLDWFLDFEKNGEKIFPVNTYSHGREGTLLMTATEMSDPEMCEYLLNKGADVKFAPTGKCSVLEWVMRQDNLTILRYLVDQRGCLINDEIIEAARYGSLKCLKYLIEEKRMSVNYLGVKNKEDGFLLGEAAGKGKTDVCRYLISKGANVNFEPVYKKGFFSDTKFKNALQMAKEGGHTETVNYLISVGAK